MTKDEFIKTLEQNLLLINDAERADILSEYEQHIQMKIESGLSEEQAIEDFGDIDQLTAEILDAYHINTKYGSKSGGFSHKLNYYLQSTFDFLTSLSTALFEKSRHELWQLLVKFIGLCIFIFALRVGVEIILNLFSPFLFILPHFLREMLRDIVKLIVALFFLCLTFYLFYYFICRYILVDYQPPKQPAYTESSFHESSFNTQEAFNTVKEKAVVLTKDMKKRAEHNEHISNFSLSDLCVKIIAFFIKFFAVLLLIPGAFVILGLAIGCGFFVVFLVKGYGIAGLFLLTLGSVLIAIACFFGIYNFVFGGGSSK